MEAVYDRNENLVTDPKNMGSFNIFDPRNDPGLHTMYDVVPYIILGNSPDDKSTVIDRISRIKCAL